MVRQWAHSPALAEVIARGSSALRSLQAIHDGSTTQATTHDLEVVRALLDAAASKLNVAIEDAFMIERGLL